MAQSYKAMKEDFVSNLSGGTIGEINLITAIAPAAILFWAILQSRHGFFEVATPVTFLADFLLNVGGILLGTTLYSSSPLVYLSVFAASSIFYLVLPAKHTPSKPAKPVPKRKDDKAKADEPNAFPARPFLTYYRGTMMVVTCASILAVDFPVFPRRFAKVETWGTSLMDLGVGSFVFSAGVVAAKAPLKDRLAGRARPMLGRLLGALRAAVPLLVLGLARLLSVKQLDYAEHVSEYGVHWNFFFTLAAVPLALAALQPGIEALPGPRYAIAGLALSAIHQALLSCTRLQAWALTAPRTDLLAANREGLTSTPGYLAIFLLGMSAGTTVLHREPDMARPMSALLRAIGLAPTTSTAPAAADRTRARLVAALVVAAAAYAALLLACSVPRVLPLLTLNISRRLANAPYVLWIAAFNAAQLAAFVLVETAAFPAMRRARSPAAEAAAAEQATSRVLGAFNQGGLLLFLAANLGTGAVNLTLDTLHTPPLAAVGVLAVYMALVTLVAVNLRGVKLKL